MTSSPAVTDEQERLARDTGGRAMEDEANDEAEDEPIVVFVEVGEGDLVEEVSRLVAEEYDGQCRYAILA